MDLKLALLSIVLTASAHAQIVQQIVSIGGVQAASGQTPGFVSEAAQNSTLTVALGTSGGAGQIAAATCASWSYCFPYAENSLSGNLGIIVYQYANSGTVVSATATDDLSDTYTCANSASTDTGKLLGMCYSANLPGTTTVNGAHKVSITFGTTAVTQVQADAAMFYNIATSSPLDGSVLAVSGASSTTMTGPTLSTSNNDLVYAFFCRTGTPLMTTGAFTVGSGFSFGMFKYQDGCASEWEVSTGGNVTPTMTMGSASTYLVIAAAFKASASVAGTVPANPYLKRFSSWSSASSVSAATIKFQFPNDAGHELVMTEAGASNYAANTITDSGSNVWELAGQCLLTGSCINSGGYSSEFYSTNAATNSINTQTVNFTGTGDATVNFYEFVGINAYDHRGQFSSSASTTNLLPATPFAFLPYTTSILYVAAGPIGFNTAVSVSSPSSAANYFDGGFFGGETLSGGGSPESVVGQNNIWSHSYATNILGTQNWQWNTSTSTSFTNVVGTDILSFLSNTASGTGVGIVQQALAQSAASITDLQVTVPATVAGNLLAVSTGFYDGATLRTVSKVCTGTSATCATGAQFAQATGSTNAGVASTLLGTDVWYLLSAPAGVTTVTVVYSGTTTNSEIMYYEVEKASGIWAADGIGAKVHNGASCTTCSGPAITPTGTIDFCIAHLATGGTVSANPASGNAWQYTGTAPAFTSGGAATSLLTNLTTAQTPVWTASAGVINSSDACFK